MESQEDSDTPKEILLNMLDFEGGRGEGILNILQASVSCAPAFFVLCYAYYFVLSFVTGNNY